MPAGVPVTVAGIDFSSAPSVRKPIVIATGTLEPTPAAVLRIERIDCLPTLAAFADWLRDPGPWVAGCDFPFGLPREFINAQRWLDDAANPPSWAQIMRRVEALSRADLVMRCRAYAAARPAGAKFAHRATDRPAGSSPSMKWVNPPVVLMLHAGAPRLLAAGVSLPGLCDGDPARVALEAYPGLLARQVLGRISYKSDDPRRDDRDRHRARQAVIVAIESGRVTGIRVVLTDAIRLACLQDFRGDRLDAVLCAVQAAWGLLRQDAGWGLPATVDPLEGWIVGAGSLGPQAPPSVLVLPGSRG